MAEKKRRKERSKRREPFSKKVQQREGRGADEEAMARVCKEQQ